MDSISDVGRPGAGTILGPCSNRAWLDILQIAVGTVTMRPMCSPSWRPYLLAAVDPPGVADDPLLHGGRAT